MWWRQNYDEYCDCEVISNENDIEMQFHYPPPLQIKQLFLFRHIHVVLCGGIGITMHIMIVESAYDIIIRTQNSIKCNLIIPPHLTHSVSL